MSIRKLNLGQPAEDILLSLVETANRPILQLIYDVAFHCCKDLCEAESRTLCVLFHSTLIHLADDIADGDCDYMDEPNSQGVTAVYSLMHLFNLSIAKIKLCSPVMIESLLRVGAAQHRELNCQNWNFEESKRAASELNGEQFKAYFYIASVGSDFEEQMVNAGYAYGISNHLMNDITDSDCRFFDLNAADQRDLISWCLNLLGQAPLSIPSSNVYLNPIHNVLTRYRN